MVLPSGPDALDAVVERYDDLLDACEEGSASVDECEKLPFSWRELLRHTGPGFLMCIAFVDPGNLEADLQTGAQTGYMLLWVVLLSTIMGYVLQDLSSRLGVATGRGLASHCAARYSPPVRRFLWVMAELAVVGSDVQEVIGTAIALELLSGGSCPLPVGVVLSGFSAFGLLLLDRMGARWLDACFQVMVAVMALTMGALFCAAGTPFGQVAGGLFVPRLTREALPIACAMVGAIIMPHNLFLHSALVAARATERERLCAGRVGGAVGGRQAESSDASKPADDSGTIATLPLPGLPPVRTMVAEDGSSAPGRAPHDENSPAERSLSETRPSSPSRLAPPALTTRPPRLLHRSPSSTIPPGAGALARAAMRYHAVESGVALAATLFINVCVVCVFAAGFAGSEGAADIGLANAHAYLARVWGPRMGLVWGVGLLAAGQSSTMTGTYAGQFIMAGFVNLRVSPAMRALITRSVALCPALAVALLAGGPTALDVLNQRINVLQSVQLPFAVLPLLTFTASPAIMGRAHASSRARLFAGALAAGLVLAVNAAAGGVAAAEWLQGRPFWTRALAGGAGAAYLSLCLGLLPPVQRLAARALGRAGRAAGIQAPAWGHPAAVPGGPVGERGLRQLLLSGEEL